MQAAELAFYTNQQLIDELLRRTTFVGVVVHSEEEFRNGRWGEERIMRVQFNDNLSLGQARRLLDSVACQMDEPCS